MHRIMFLGVIVILASFQGVFLETSVPKLIIISYSGFRYDYFNRNATPFMNQLRENWVDTEYMTNVFVTKTHPNHFSIATGLYTETHGVIENRVFHPEGAVITNSLELYAYEDGILPIWIVNEISGGNRSSGSMMWPGGEYEFNGTRASHVAKIGDEENWESRIDLLISWFIDPVHPINLAMLYFEEPDFHAHAYGTEHPIIDDLLSRLDNITKYLYDQLEKKNLTDVNVIHLSDHGLADAPVSKIINITEIIGDENYETLGSPSTKFIKPKANGKKIYAKLKVSAEITRGFDVYWKDDIPERFHLRENRRVTEIFLIAKRGFIFEEVVEKFDFWESTFDIKITNESVIASAGYDNDYPEMRPFFFATGPAFVKNCTLEPFDNVDLFSLFCRILEIECVKSNGTVESFGDCLMELKDEAYVTNLLIVVAIVAVVLMAVIAALIIFSAKRHRRDQFIIDSYRKSAEEIAHAEAYQKKSAD